MKNLDWSPFIFLQNLTSQLFLLFINVTYISSYRSISSLIIKSGSGSDKSGSSTIDFSDCGNSWVYISTLRSNVTLRQNWLRNERSSNSRVHVSGESDLWSGNEGTCSSCHDWSRYWSSSR